MFDGIVPMLNCTLGPNGYGQIEALETGDVTEQRYPLFESVGFCPLLMWHIRHL